MTFFLIEESSWQRQPVRPCCAHQFSLVRWLCVVLPDLDNNVNIEDNRPHVYLHQLLDMTYCPHLTLYGCLSLSMFGGARQKHTVWPVTDLRHSDVKWGEEIQIKTQWCDLAEGIQNKISRATCITRSKMKLSGRPNTVNISPLLSSIHRMIFFFIQPLSSILNL